MNDSNQNFPAGPSSDSQNQSGYAAGPSDENAQMNYTGRPSTDDDLLSQISAQDIKDSAAERQKSRHSITMEMVVLFMKITFILDDAKRKNQKLFDVLGLFWGAFLALVYLCGIGMLILLMYSYSQFPLHVRQNLAYQGIAVKDYQIQNYSLSKVVLDNLEAKNGTYSIKRMEIHSTFADFIKGRVKSVVLDGVKIRIKETKNGLEMGDFPQALLDINQSSLTQKVKVDSLSLTNATLEIDGKDYNLPISFSLTGVYERDSKISIPLFIKEKDINVVGSLSITGKGREKVFVLKITSGTLTFPQRSPENIVGELTVSTRQMQPEKMAGNFSLSYGRNIKKVDFNFDKGRDNLYRGGINLAVTNVDNADEKKEVKSTLGINFEGISINSIHNFSTNKPIRVVVQSFKNQDVQLTNVSAILNGEFACNNLACSYRIRQFSPVFVKESSVLFNADVIKSKDEYSFSFAPNNQDTLVWKKGKISYDAKIERASFSGYRNAHLTPISLTAGTINLRGFYDFSNVTQKMAIDVQRMSAVLPEFSMTGANFKNDNLFDENASISLSAEQVTLMDNDVFKAPFKLKMDKSGLDTKAVLGMDNNIIQISFSGLSRLLSGEFKGNVFIHPIDLKNVSKPLDQFFGLFPSGIENPTGEMAGLGSVYWKNSKQITGPLYVGFKNVGFKIKDTTVSGLNTVLSFQTIAPLLTPAGQKISIGQIGGAIPLQNILLDIKLEPQFIKLSSAMATIAGLPMQSDSALIAMRSTAFTLFLRNNAVDWAMAYPYLNLDGISLGGKGTILLPIEFKDGGVSIKNAEAKMNNGEIGLEKAKGEWITQNLADVKNLFVRTASVFLNTSENNRVNIMLSVDGRTQPGQQLKNIKDNFDVPLEKIIRPVRVLPVPPEIIKKQHIIFK